MPRQRPNAASPRQAAATLSQASCRRGAHQRETLRRRARRAELGVAGKLIGGFDIDIGIVEEPEAEFVAQQATDRNIEPCFVNLARFD